MKIYFYDGALTRAPKTPISVVRIDARYGFAYCKGLVEFCQKQDEDVLTNSTYLLNGFGWDEQTNKWEVWIWQEKSQAWVNVQDLTDKDLRREHNLERLYRAGHFDEENK